MSELVTPQGTPAAQAKLDKDNPTFRVSFHIEAWPEGIEKKDLREGFAGCDSILQVVMVHDKEKGRKHYSVMSMDGERSEPLTLGEQWEAWYVLGRALSQQMRADDPDDGWKQQVCEGLIEVVAAMRKDGRRKKDTGVVDAQGRKIRT